MKKTWLLFAQTVAAVALVLAALVALDRLVPGLLPRAGSGVTIREVANGEAARGVASYADAAAKSRPSVVNIFTSKEVRAQRNPFMDDPVLRRFFGGRFNGDNRPQRHGVRYFSPSCLSLKLLR